MTAIREIIESEKYKDVLFVLMWVLSFKDKKSKIEYLSNLYNDFITSECDLNEGQDNAIFFVRSLAREDYSILFSSIISSCNSYPSVRIETFRNKKIEFNADAASFLYDHEDLLDKIQVNDPIDRQCAFLLLISFGFKLEKYAKKKPAALVCFSDMQPIEALFSIYFKSKGVPTVTIQHGLYVEYLEYKTINVLNYLSHNSDYFLSWGEQTAGLIKEYHPDTNVVICGKPKIHSRKHPLDHNKPYILVILDQNIFKTENFNLIRISFDLSEEKGLDIFFRFHPGINGKIKEDYLVTFPRIKERHELDGAELIIGHTSSLLFEALEINKKVLQYKTDIPTINLPKELQFIDYTSLKRSIDNYKVSNYSNVFFDCTGDKAIKNYQCFFEWLVTGKTNRIPKRFHKSSKAFKKRPTWVCEMENKFYSRSQKLGSIIIPCLTSDLDSLFFMLNAWADERLSPRVLDGEKPHLLILFNRDNEYVKNKAESFWRDIPRLSLYFSGISVKSAGLNAASDLYVKERPKSKVGKFGNTAGPNFLFQHAMNFAHRWPGYTLLVEVDCLPLKKDWLTSLEQVIKRASGAWVIGSMYIGTFRINNPIMRHLNGNALYNVGDPNFINFLNNVWMPRLIQYADVNPNVAYDLWWEIENSNACTKYIDEKGGWNTLKKYSSFFYNDPFVLNLLESDDLSMLIAKYDRHFSSLHKEIIMVHSKHIKEKLELFLTSSNGNFLDYLSGNVEKRVEPVVAEQKDLLVQLNLNALNAHASVETEMVRKANGTLPDLPKELSFDMILKLLSSESITKDLARFLIVSLTTKLICSDSPREDIAMKLDKNVMDSLRRAISVSNKAPLKALTVKVFQRYGINLNL